MIDIACNQESYCTTRSYVDNMARAIERSRFICVVIVLSFDMCNESHVS